MVISAEGHPDRWEGAWASLTSTPAPGPSREAGEDDPPHVARPFLGFAAPCPNDCRGGLVACWSPGGPCPPGRDLCDLCGPCLIHRPEDGR